MALAPQAPARWRLVPGLPAPLVLEALALALLAQAPFGPSGLGAPAWAGWGFELALSVVPLSMLRRWSLEDLEGKRARSKGVCRTALGRCGLAGHREEPSEGSGRELHVLAATGSRFEAAIPEEHASEEPITDRLARNAPLGRASHNPARAEPPRSALQEPVSDEPATASRRQPTFPSPAGQSGNMGRGPPGPADAPARGGYTDPKRNASPSRS
jgi:hypothetical protein